MSSSVETAAAPAPMTQPGPLAALALVVAIPATFILGRPDALARWLFDGAGGTSYRGEALLGLLVSAAGLGAVLFIGRGTLGVRRTLVLAIATWAALGFSTLVLFLAAFADAFDNCGGGTHHPLTASVVVAAGVAYVAVAYWALRKGWWWGVPLAVVLALVFCFILAEALPAVPKSTGDCSD